jgi:glycolate oxidase FAD binding subunit
MDPTLQALQERVRAAVASKTPLAVAGGGTKAFYGNAPRGAAFDVRAVNGIVDYEPTELVVTVRGGTPLAELESRLAEQNQMLPFEPPHFGPAATVGGAIASGLAGPRRMAAGAVRDFVLGVRLLDGRGQMLSFGGRVMKNVAGYDVARALTGSLGTLGVIVEASLKVLPRPVAEQTLLFEMNEAESIHRVNEWGGQPLPVSATMWCGGQLYVRLSGAAAGVQAAHARMGGSPVPEAALLWAELREQSHDFFAPGRGTLWRLAVPPTTGPLDLGATLIEWNGGQRWVWSDAPAEKLRARVEAAGGHATQFRGGERRSTFHPLPPALAAIHRRLKAEFDPAGIFNPGRLYPEF